jgi:alpha-mannosidase
MTIVTPQISATRAVRTQQARQQAALERLRSELQFAALLCRLHPDRAAEWEPLLAQATREADELAAADPDVSLEAVTAAVEAVLAPLAATAKSYHVYGIGHAHIDMNWQWAWPETVAVVTDTFTTVLRLMEEFPDFHFSQSQAAIYRILEQHHPELLARIAERVQERRWEVTASHWVEGDKNLANGESLCRHLLYTRRYLQGLFGLAPDDVAVDWAPDTFGHAATVPTYLAQGGVRHCFLHRPGAHAEGWPQAFRWFGPDGASVLVFNGMRGGYNGVFCPCMMLERLESWYAETGVRVAPYLYGVGDHGGGPTRRDLRRFEEMRAWPIFPTLRLTTATAFFAELEGHAGRLPEVHGELNFVFTGCYTSQSQLKKANRLGENRLDDAERATALAWAAVDAGYDATRFEEAWRTVLFSQFHDILPGSCVAASRVYSQGLFQECMATAGLEETKALRQLAAAVDTHSSARSLTAHTPPMAAHSGFAGGVGSGTQDGGLSQADGGSTGDERPFVLFNLEPLAQERIVEAVVWENARDSANLPFHRQTFTVEGPDGQTCAAQVLEKNTYWGHDFVRLAFPACVPALGYARYCVHGNAAENAELVHLPALAPLQLLPSDATPASTATAQLLGRSNYPARYSFHDLAEEGLENDRLRVELDARSGGIRRLLDKATGLELITPAQPAPVLEFGVERPHAMSSWVLDHALHLEPLTCTGLRRKEHGPYVAAMELTFTVRASEFVLTYEVRVGDPRLYVRLQGTWREFGSAQAGVPFLRLAIPTALTDATLTGEIPFGAVEREFHQGEEIPALQWTLLRGRCAGRDAGVLLVNDCKYGHAVEGNTLRVNLIRSTYDPDPQPEIGQHEMAFALQVVPGDFSVADSTHAGRAFNHPLRVVGTDLHAGELPATGTLLCVESADMIVPAVKKAEDAEVLIVRLSNPGPAAKTAVIRPGSALGRIFTGACLTDLLERPLPASAVLVPDRTGAVHVPIPAHGLATVRLALG